MKRYHETRYTRERYTAPKAQPVAWPLGEWITGFLAGAGCGTAVALAGWIAWGLS